MGLRWFWYISAPKLRELEDQSTSPIVRFLRHLKLGITLSAAKLKASVSHDGPIPSGIVRRVDTIEAKLRLSSSLGSVSDVVLGERPLFFEFKGVASRYIQSGFDRRKPPEDEGENFYPSGAFVVAGFADRTAVVLIGSAANMYGCTRTVAQISTVSQAPMLYLHRLAGDHDASGDDVVLRATRSVYSRCDPNTYERVHAVAVLGAHVCLTSDAKSTSEFELPLRSMEVPEAVRLVDHIVIGSPLFVEQLPGAGSPMDAENEVTEGRA